MAIILVVDDNDSVREVLRMILERGTPHRVVGAAHAEAALRLLETHTPEIALIDIEMPGMNGYELCQTLRASPKWAELPIIMMTGRAITGVLEQVQAAGAQQLIAKPFARAELLATIQSLIAKN